MAKFQHRLPIRNDLTRLQRLAIDDDNPIIVTGVPGSGKTVVAVYRVARLTGNSILFTYTRMLTVAIKGSVNENLKEASNKVASIYEWFWSRCNILLGGIINNDTEIQNSLQNNNIRFDELIFDEAQDLPITLYSAFNRYSNKISIGADEAQLVFSNGCTELELTNLFINHNSHELDQNHRNTFEIFDFARFIVPENERAQNPPMLDKLKNERRGDKPLIVIHNDLVEIKNVFKQILLDNIGGNIGILLIHREDVDIYYRFIKNDIAKDPDSKAIDCCYYYGGMPRPERNQVENNLKNILVTTFKSAKGMEFDTVIIPEFQLLTNEFKTQYFVGCTRAKSNLFIFTKSSLPEVAINNIPVEKYLKQDNRKQTSNFSNADDLPF
ncbi:MAG: DUF2075 domain-containing protein [Bacteroidales bacterium]|nr:DUF2075 domain-containing protein [Bacteroidales bacterium]